MYLRRKKKGLSTMIGSLAMIFLLVVLFYFSFYMKCIETINLNLKDDADIATLASATVDLNKFGQDHKNLHCMGSANTDYMGQDSLKIKETGKNLISVNEKNEMRKHLTQYSNSLVSTMGIVYNASNESKTFSGGNVGWAANSLGARDFKLDNFKIYEFINNKWICYEVKNLSTKDLMTIKDLEYTYDSNNNVIVKNDSGTIEDFFNSLTLTKKNVTAEELTKDGIVENEHYPTVCATFSFTMDLPNFFGFSKAESLNDLKIKSISQVKGE